MNASQVRECRMAIGLTQAEFSVLIGVSRATVNRWENGRTRVPRKKQGVILTSISAFCATGTHQGFSQTTANPSRTDA